MGVFEFVIVLVVVSTIAKIVTDFGDRRALPPAGTASSGEIDALRDAIADLGSRVHQLEEERDFYRELLEAPPESRGLEPGTDPGDGL